MRCPSTNFIIQPKSSRWLSILLLLMHCEAIISIFLIISNHFLLFILIVLTTGHFIFLLRKHVWGCNAHSIKRISYQTDQIWSLFLKNQSILVADLIAYSLLTRYLIILNFQVVNKKECFSVIIVADSETDENLRKLRFILNSRY